MALERSLNRDTVKSILEGRGGSVIEGEGRVNFADAAVRVSVRGSDIGSSSASQAAAIFSPRFLAGTSAGEREEEHEVER